MALFVTVPISTQVIESNPDCALSGAYENGVLVITIDSRGQNVHQRLGLGSKTRLHWGAEHRFEVQELSGLTWPIRYRVITRDGYYLQKSQRVHFTTSARGPAQFSGQKRHASPAMTGNRTRRLSLREGSGQLSADLSGREVSRLDCTSIAPAKGSSHVD